MNLLNISPFAQYVVRGLILLAAVLFDRYKQVRKAPYLSDVFRHPAGLASARCFPGKL